MPEIIFLFPGFIIALILLFYPVLATWTMLIMALVVAGTVTYFIPELGLIRWAVVPISLALFFRAILSIITYTPPSKKVTPPFFIFGFFLVFAVVILSTAINLNVKEALIAAKNFFQFWSIPLAFIYVIKSKESISKIMMSLLCIAAIEPLLAIIQNLYFIGNYPGDSVTGTFGGQIAGGGPNAALTIYMVIQITIIFSLLSKNLIKPRYGVILILWFSIPIFLSHSKLAAIYFPIVAFVLFGKKLLKKPFAGLLIIAVVISMGFGVFYYHYTQIGRYSAKGKEIHSFTEYYKQILSYNIAEKERGKKLSRTASISFWWKENASFFRNPTQMFIGHGLGATKQSGIIWGHVANSKEYRDYSISRYALPRLLWDLGLVGTFLFILIFVNAYFIAGRLKNNPMIPESQQSFLIGDQIACLLFLISMPYQLSIINTQAYNAYSMFVLGHIGFWAVEVKRRQSNPSNEPGI